MGAYRPAVWLVLQDVALDAEWRDGRLVASTSARLVAEHLRLDPGTAAAALRALRKAGLVELGQTSGPDGRFGLAGYTLHLPDGIETLSPNPAEPHTENPHTVNPHAVRSGIEVGLVLTCPWEGETPSSPPTVAPAVVARSADDGRARRSRDATADRERRAASARRGESAARRGVALWNRVRSTWGRTCEPRACRLPEGLASVCRTFPCRWGTGMLTVTALTNAEYVLSSVALGIDEYYTGVGEAPGVWAGSWSKTLGLVGMVEADQLRALIEGNDPSSQVRLLTGRERTVKAFDLTFSAPKSVSLLWALGSEPVADVVAAAHREAVTAAAEFLEGRAALARVQVDGVRRHVPTDGWVVAGFVHRTSRAGDPQLHTHCVVPNVVCREDGRCVAIAARPMYVWARAAGSVYQAELQRLLGLRLGVQWQADRNNTREIVGFERAGVAGVLEADGGDRGRAGRRPAHCTSRRCCGCALTTKRR